MRLCCSEGLGASGGSELLGLSEDSKRRSGEIEPSPLLSLAGPSEGGAMGGAVSLAGWCSVGCGFGIWRVRESTCGELTSVLYTPCRDIGHVVLDPLPE